MNWSANSETDLAGYYVYYGASPRTDTNPNNCSADGSMCGYTEKIDVGNVTTHVLNFSRGKYYFTLTAYDTSGHESSFSAELEKTK